MEGHPDNVAPALFGGLTIAWIDRRGPGAQAAPGAPRRRAGGVRARVDALDQAGALPAAGAVPHEDAAFNVSRSALLVAALIQSPELLLAATEDRLHQATGRARCPRPTRSIRVLREAGLAAVVSGAGPRLLVLGSDPAQRLLAAELVAEHADPTWRAAHAGRRSRGCYSGAALGETRPRGSQSRS